VSVTLSNLGHEKPGAVMPVQKVAQLLWAGCTCTMSLRTVLQGQLASADHLGGSFVQARNA